MQSAASIERQLPHHTTVAVTYRNIAQFGADPPDLR
jgi:hypothetical protein